LIRKSNTESLTFYKSTEAALSVLKALKGIRGAEDWVKQHTFPMAACMLYVGDKTRQNYKM
jgi:hypothetical protein